MNSLYQHYPGFEEHMRKALRVLLGEEVEKKVEMGLAKDGSGVGGALPLTFAPEIPHADFPFPSLASRSISRARCFTSDEKQQVVTRDTKMNMMQTSIQD
jgi:hypothetical protein